MRRIVQKNKSLPGQIVGITAILMVAVTAITWIGIVSKRSS